MSEEFWKGLVAATIICGLFYALIAAWWFLT
jgi:hypothetical protein